MSGDVVIKRTDKTTKESLLDKDSIIWGSFKLYDLEKNKKIKQDGNGRPFKEDGNGNPIYLTKSEEKTLQHVKEVLGETSTKQKDYDPKTNNGISIEDATFEWTYGDKTITLPLNSGKLVEFFVNRIKEGTKGENPQMPFRLNEGVKSTPVLYTGRYERNESQSSVPVYEVLQGFHFLKNPDKPMNMAEHTPGMLDLIGIDLERLKKEGYLTENQLSQIWSYASRKFTREAIRTTWKVRSPEELKKLFEKTKENSLLTRIRRIFFREKSKSIQFLAGDSLSKGKVFVKAEAHVLRKWRVPVTVMDVDMGNSSEPFRAAIKGLIPENNVKFIDDKAIQRKKNDLLNQKSTKPLAP